MVGKLKHWFFRTTVPILALCLPLLAVAQDIRFSVTAWQLEGEIPVGERAAQAVLAPFLGPQTGLEGLRKAASALEERLHEAGYTFYRVVLPPQEIRDGAVRLMIHPFTVGEISTEGNQYHSDDNIRRSLPALRPGESPNARKLSANLALANLNPSKRAKLTFGPGAEPGRLDARIEVSDKDPRRSYLWLNDTGNENTGEYRLGVGYHDANFLDRDHQFNASLTTSPTEPNQVAQGGLNWRMPHYRSNGLFSAMAVESDVESGTVAEFFDVRGRGSVYGLAYSKVLPRVGRYRQVTTLGITDKYFDSDVGFSGQAIGVDVRSRPLSLDYTGEFRGDTLKLKFSLGAAGNLSGGSDNDDATYARARLGAEQGWSLFRFDLDSEKTVGSFTVSTTLSAQYADEPLISGEQIGLGGARNVRGFEEREFTGDRGFWARLEVITPRYGNGLRFGWFVDGGRVERVEAAAGEPDRIEAVSTGLLLTWEFKRRLLLHADFAHVLDLSGASDLGPTREGDERAHFNISYFFE